MPGAAGGVGGAGKKDPKSKLFTKNSVGDIGNLPDSVKPVDGSKK